MVEDSPSPSAESQATGTEPFFLVGAERSGTTLLRLMLDHHPSIRCQFESSFLVDYLGKDGQDPIQDWVQHELAMDRVARMTGFQVRDGHGYKEEVRAFVEQARVDSGKAIGGATIHRRFPDLLHIWPEAKFINLVRDPRDVAPSVIAMGWAGNTYFGAKLWKEAQVEARQLQELVPPERFLSLRFEDLVTDPVETLTKVCGFLGLDYHEDLLSYPEDSTYPPPDASAAARWRKKLSPKEVQLAEACAGDWLEQTGYESAGHPPLKIGGFRAWLLHLQNRLGKIRFRCDRYGFPMVLNYAISHRIGLTKRSEAILLQMQERDNDFLR